MKNKLLNYILNEASAEERSALHTWKNEAQANMEGLKSLHEDDDAFEILRNYEEVNTEQAWHVVESQTSTTRTVFYKRLPKVAAVLIIVLMALGGLYFMMHSNRISTDDLMVYNSLTIPEIAYKDGSHIVLDKHSELQELKFRNFKLNGRAFFSVARDIKHPFTVETNLGTVEVLGTEFNVSTTSNTTEVYVKEGSVKVKYLNKEHILRVGDYLTITKSGTILHQNPSIQPDIWKKPGISFKNQSFHSVIETIAVYYNLQLEWNESVHTSDNCKINTEFQKENIESVLKELQMLTQFQYKLTENKIIVYSYKC